MNKDFPGYGKKVRTPFQAEGQAKERVCLTTTALSARGNITGHSAGIPAALYASSEGGYPHPTSPPLALTLGFY
ncbi:hypothetical protein Q3G72_012607 [Acer saccharum]|nr:hypothetical protein Q3G72_012607 [Acer saccharum]